MIILRYHEVFFRLAAPTAMPAHLGAYSLEKASWYRNIIILLGVEEHPKFHEKFRENDLGRLNKLSNFAPACTDSTQHTVAAAPYFFSMRFPWK